MIKIENLVKKYGTETVLDISSLTIPAGECFGLVGNNGAGKTTLFRLILDQIKATQGRVWNDGTAVQQNNDWKKHTGAYIDRHMLLGYLTADEYFEVLCKMNGLSPGEMEDQLAPYEPLFNEEIRANNKYIRELSKGNTKKTGIAAALLGTKKVVLLDEPFENLDPTSQNRLKKIITKEKQRGMVTFLISSHDLTHVTDICDRIVLLEKGIIKQDLKAGKQEMVQALDDYFNV